MNHTVKLLIGAAVGAGFGYFVGAVIVEIIKLKEESSVLDFYEDEENEDDLIEGKIEELKESNSIRRKELMGNKKLKTKNYTEYFKNQDRPELAALAAKYNGGDLPNTIQDGILDNDLLKSRMDEAIEEDFNQVEDESEVTDPSIISLAEFANAEGFDCMTLNYYDDDVVTDEQDNPIYRPEQILGDEALVSFGELSEDEDVVYIRNLAKKAMYEVVRTNKEYTLTEPKQLPQRRALKKEEYNGEDENT